MSNRPTLTPSSWGALRSRASKDDRARAGPSPFEARRKRGSHLRVTVRERFRLKQSCLEAPRGRRAVDALETPGAIERVQAAAGPERTGMQDGFDPLLERVIVQPREGREA